MHEALAALLGREISPAKNQKVAQDELSRFHRPSTKRGTPSRTVNLIFVQAIPGTPILGTALRGKIGPLERRKSCASS
jgi:hypothetical protein